MDFKNKELMLNLVQNQDLLLSESAETPGDLFSFMSGSVDSDFLFDDVNSIIEQNLKQQSHNQSQTPEAPLG